MVWNATDMQHMLCDHSQVICLDLVSKAFQKGPSEQNLRLTVPLSCEAHYNVKVIFFPNFPQRVVVRIMCTAMNSLQYVWSE